MQYRAILRLLSAGGVGVGTYLRRDSDMMMWLDGVATLKDVGEVVAWVLGRRNLEQWAGRAGGKKWALHLIGFLGISVAAYVGRHSDLMDWLAHIASIKDVSEAVSWVIGPERLVRWGDVFLREAEYRCAISQYDAAGLLKKVVLPYRKMQMMKVSALSDSPYTRRLILGNARRRFDA